MPRQRSKKLSATLQNEHSSESEREDQNESDNASLGMLEKDEEEEELARLVLGDVAGFKAQLGQHMELDAGSEEGEGLAEEDSGGEVDLENVDDAEVRKH
jgi:U3 small nucleolar RNA-associated protein 18